MTKQHYRNQANNAEKRRVEGHRPRGKLIKELRIICICVFFVSSYGKTNNVFIQPGNLFKDSNFFQVVFFSFFLKFPSSWCFSRVTSKFQVFPDAWEPYNQRPNVPLEYQEKLKLIKRNLQASLYIPFSRVKKCEFFLSL